MRFAIGLLAILADVCVVGTVLKQNQPNPDYIVQKTQDFEREYEQVSQDLAGRLRAKTAAGERWEQERIAGG